MTFRYGATLRNNQASQIQSSVGSSGTLKIFSGAEPANCAAADSGTLLCQMTLPSDWMNAASGGTKTFIAPWTDVGVAAGNAGHFRIKDSTVTTTGLQGSCTATGGGGDMTIDNVVIAVAQAVTVNSFTLTAPNP